MKIRIIAPEVHLNQPIYLAGSVPELGSWVSQGLRCEALSDGTHEVTIPAGVGQSFQGLFTLGHWRSVENMGHGGEKQPRQFELGRDGEVQIAGWGRNSVRYHADFASQYLPEARTLTVYLPPGYDSEAGRRYTVLYMHDGQNLFDPHTAFAGQAWGCDELAEQAIRQGRCQSLIIVGISNTADRIREYGPRRCGRSRQEDYSRQYGQMLVEEIKPWIDQQYRTVPGPQTTGVGGSSMGGLISLYLCKWYPKVFGICAAMSPSLWWDREYFLRNLKVHDHWLQTCRIWLDMGGREGATPLGMKANVRRARQLAQLLAEYQREDGTVFRYFEDPIGGHDERAWGYRFAQVLEFLWPKQQKPPIETSDENLLNAESF